MSIPSRIETTSDAAGTEIIKGDIASTPLKGWRLRIVLASVFIGLFLSFLDSTIVAVALPTIADQFDDFSRSTWVITAYLLTYIAFGIIMARLSDIFGKKAIEVVAFVIFLVFSLACALSRTMLQLIVFRALQGIGGSGLFSMTMVISLNIVEAKRMPTISVMVALTQVTSGVLGPILGGVIAHNRTSSDWRWIFWLNLPLGGLALLGLLLAWPHDKSRKNYGRKAFASIDYLGATLLLAFSILLVFALQEAGTFALAWRSAATIVSLTLSGVALALFLAWQELLARRPAWTVTAIFPIEVAKMRVMGNTTIVTLLTGFVFYIAVVNLPERFQIVSGDGSIIAGLKLLPLSAASATGSLVAGGASKKRNNTSLIIAIGTGLQVLGYGLMSTLDHGRSTPKALYGYEVFLGLGFGLSIASATLMVQLQCQNRPHLLAATQGALTQMRSLGGSIGLAIAVIIFNSHIKSSKTLAAALTPEQAAALFKSPLTIESLEPYQQALVSETYAQAFEQEMRVATYVVAVAFVFSLLGLERHPPQPSAELPKAGENAATVVERFSVESSTDAQSSEKAFARRECNGPRHEKVDSLKMESLRI